MILCYKLPSKLVLMSGYNLDNNNPTCCLTLAFQSSNCTLLWSSLDPAPIELDLKEPFTELLFDEEFEKIVGSNTFLKSSVRTYPLLKWSNNLKTLSRRGIVTSSVGIFKTVNKNWWRSFLLIVPSKSISTIRKASSALIPEIYYLERKNTF